MIHNQMSHNQAKKWVLSLVYRAAIDFKKSKKIENTSSHNSIEANMLRWMHANKFRKKIVEKK